MKKNKTFPFILLLLYFSILLNIMGCGKKGPLSPPEGSTYSYPASYPPEE